MYKSILKASFITMISKDMKKYSDEPIHFSNEEQTEFYSLYESQPCDRSDMAELNNNLADEKITIILDISTTKVGKEKDWTHIIKDSDGFYFVVNMV